MLEIEEYLFKERFDTKYLYQHHICLMRVLIILLSVRYNVCNCHSPIYHYTIVTVVHLVYCIIAVCVVVM